MRFTSRRFRQQLRKARKTRRLKRKATKTRRHKKQRGGGNTFTRSLPPAAIIADPGTPPREKQDPPTEGALD